MSLDLNPPHAPPRSQPADLPPISSFHTKYTNTAHTEARIPTFSTNSICALHTTPFSFPFPPLAYAIPPLSYTRLPTHTHSHTPTTLLTNTPNALLLAFTHFPPTSFLVAAPPQPHPTRLLFNAQYNHHLLSNILQHTRDCPSATQLSLLSIPLPFQPHLRFNNPYKTHTFKHSHKSSPFS